MGYHSSSVSQALFQKKGASLAVMNSVTLVHLVPAPSLPKCISILVRCSGVIQWWYQIIQISFCNWAQRPRFGAQPSITDVRTCGTSKCHSLGTPRPRSLPPGTAGVTQRGWAKTRSFSMVKCSNATWFLCPLGFDTVT